MEDGTWVSVLGVLVKVVAITAAGWTINQKLPRGETEALTWTLYSAGHTHAHTPADRLSHGFVTFLCASVLLLSYFLLLDLLSVLISLLTLLFFFFPFSNAFSSGLDCPFVSFALLSTALFFSNMCLGLQTA